MLGYEISLVFPDAGSQWTQIIEAVHLSKGRSHLGRCSVGEDMKSNAEFRINIPRGIWRMDKRWTGHKNRDQLGHN